MSTRIGLALPGLTRGQGVSIAIFRYFHGRPGAARLVVVGYQKLRAADLVALRRKGLTPMRMTVVGWLSLDRDIPLRLMAECIPRVAVLGHRTGLKDPGTELGLMSSTDS